jgi:hypothetical protein
MNQKTSSVDQTLLWATTSGLRCVMLPYDERRFQLRLIRREGTVRTDLFVGRAAALSAARQWLDRIGDTSTAERIEA